MRSDHKILFQQPDPNPGLNCDCKGKFSITKKRNLKNRSEGKSLQYPKPNELRSKTFLIKYENKLSLVAKFVLNSVQNKFIYYAIEDILYLLKSNPIEKDNILTILYSPVLSLQNDLFINFFDIWIHEIYIDEESKVNKFFHNDSYNFEPFNYITIKLLYKTGETVKKTNPLW